MHWLWLIGISGLMRKLILLLALFIMAGGCVKKDYRKDLTKGLATIRQDNIFRVELSDIDSTELSKARDLALLKCSEVTIERGYQYFTILHEKGFGKDETQGKAIPAYLIKCFQEKPQDASEETIFNAKQLRKEMRHRYKIET